MSARSLSPTEMAFRRPGHPLDCLRIIVLPECVVCGNPTKYYCGGCRAGPAFCSSEHYMEVCFGVLHTVVRLTTAISASSTGPCIHDIASAI